MLGTCSLVIILSDSVNSVDLIKSLCISHHYKGLSVAKISIMGKMGKEMLEL